MEALHTNDLGELRAPMGGYGSGWQGSKRETVNDSLSLSIAALVRKGALVAGARTSYDCVVATTSKATAQKALGTKDVERYFEASPARRAARRPGVVFKKLHGVKRKFEAWD